MKKINPITDKQQALTLLCQLSYNPATFKKFSLELRSDPEVVKKAIELNPMELEHSAEHLRNDPDITTLAIRRWSPAFEHAGDRLKNDQQFILGLMGSEPMESDIFRYCHLRADKPFVLKVLATNPSCFQYVASVLRRDPDICCLALREPVNFCYISSKWRNNEAMCLHALAHITADYQCTVFEHMSARLRNNGDFMRKAIEIQPEVFRFASLELKSNIALLRRVLEKLGHSIPEYHTTTQAMLAPLIRGDGRYIRFGCEDIINDPRMAMVVLKSNLSYFGWLGMPLQQMLGTVLGTDRTQFIPRLKKIIAMEKLTKKLNHDTVANPGEPVGKTVPKTKI